MLTAVDDTVGVYEAILPSLITIEAALDGRNAAVTAGTEHRQAMLRTGFTGKALLNWAPA